MILLYDGVCGLCNDWVQFTLNRDPAGRFRFAPLQGSTAERILSKYGKDPKDLDTVYLVLDPDGPKEQLLWKGRKNAFGAIGRVSPFYYVHDGVVPRTQIAPTLRRIGEIARQQALTIGNIFHAGDGNMHPIILFDARKPGDLGRAQKAGFDILEYCIQVGGSITGEHGIGMEKVHLMDKQFSVESLDMMRRIRDLFDPGRLFNPGKLLPAGRGCAEIRQPPLIAGNPVY